MEELNEQIGTELHDLEVRRANLLHKQLNGLVACQVLRVRG